MEKESNPLLKFLSGVLLGIFITYLYVRFDYTLPGWLQIGSKVSSGAAVITAEIDLYDPTAPLDARKRALAVVVAQQPEMFIEIDDAIDNRFFDEVLRKKAEREAKLLRSQFRAYDVALEKEALRGVLERKHGVKEPLALKRKMLAFHLRKEELLHAYLRKRFPEASMDQLVDVVLGVYQNELRPSRVEFTTQNDQAPMTKHQ